MLAACNEARVPVTAAAGRSGVCGGSIPVHGGVALDLTGLDGRRRASTRPRSPPTCGPARSAPTSRTALGKVGRRLHARALAAVDGPVDRRRLARLPRGGPVLDALREDRGHGDRPRGRAGRRPRRAHRGQGPPRRHRAEPHPALRRQRGHARRHHRGAAAHPPPPARPGAPRLRLRARSPPASTRAAASCAGAPPRPCCASTTRPSRSATSNSGDTNVLIVLDEADPDVLAGTMAVVDEECGAAAGARSLDVALVERWLGHRNDVSALAPLWRAGVVVDTAEISGAWAALPAPLRRGRRRAEGHRRHAGRVGAPVARLRRRRLPVLHLRRARPRRRRRVARALLPRRPGTS